MKRYGLFLALSLLAAPALGEEITIGDLVIDDPHAMASMRMAKAGAGYLVIRNSGTTDDRLIGASAAFARVMVHTTEFDANGVARMKHLEDGLPIPAGGEAVLEPGGHHIMFMGLKAPLVAGEAAAVVLEFEAAGEVPVTFEVRARN